MRITIVNDLQHKLYRLAKDSPGDPDYLKHNKILWNNITALDDEAVMDAMEVLAHD